MKNCVILTTTSNGDGLKKYLYESEIFDLYIIDYTSEKDKSPLKSEYIKYIYETNGGFKFHNIKNLILSLDLLEKYDYFWFPDWDISFPEKTVEKLFEFAEHYNLDLCQPSLSLDSHISWSITQTNPDSSVRFTNFVEVMCPLFKSSFLKEVLWTFDLNYSSWGLDFLWPTIYKNKNIGIVDSVVVKHERPVTSHQWVLPNYKNAMQELKEMQKEFNLILIPKVFKSLS
jgi:hypothetical protein